jgi:hypothetical protein
MIRDVKMAGFCPLQQILDNIDIINKPGDIFNPDPKIWCGPIPAKLTFTVDGKQYKYEHVEDFNHFFYFDNATNGGEFNRNDHIEIFGDLAMGLGNAGSYNPESPYLPGGLTLKKFQDWMADPQKCNPGHELLITDKPWTCNKEYNPDCSKNIVIFCDGEVPVCCKQGGTTVCGGVCEGTPEYAVHRGKYEPEGAAYPDGTYHHTNPFIVMAAVDINGNGIRDYGEPLMVNMGERYQDVGADGCADATEDGKGGCCKDADFSAGTCTRPYNKDTNPDPNKDNFDSINNAGGTEGNWLYDTGEPYDDFGLDGVKVDSAKGIPVDYGEGNGKYDMSPNAENFYAHDIAMNLAKLLKDKGQSALDRLDIFIDGGIRDIFNSGVMNYTIVGKLRSLGIDVKQYDHFFGFPTSIAPQYSDDAEYLNNVTRLDYSAKKMGKNVVLLYGKPEATAKEIQDGDGAHVGTPNQAVERFLTYFMFATKRWPHPDNTPYDEAGTLENSSYYSKSLDGSRRYTIFFPPGFNKPENATKLYPVIYFMHGYGMGAEDMATTALIIQTAMSDGSMPKSIMVFPEGKCCRVNRAKGLRECGCSDDSVGGKLKCIDKTGQEKLIPSSDLEDRECNRGSFYLDMVSDKWGDPASAAVMKYEGSILDLMEHVDKTYRVRPPEDVIVK